MGYKDETFKNQKEKQDGRKKDKVLFREKQVGQWGPYNLKGSTLSAQRV